MCVTPEERATKASDVDAVFVVSSHIERVSLTREFPAKLGELFRNNIVCFLNVRE